MPTQSETLVHPTDPRTVPGAADGHRPKTAYVLKMYPRFSETFVLHEMLAREAAGEELEVFSLRLPVDGHFHAELAQLQAPVTYLPRGRSGEEVWTAVRAAHRNGLVDLAAEVVNELFAADAATATQALALATAVRERGITHLHAHFASISTTVARLASRLSGVPYSFTAHAKDIFHSEVDQADLGSKLADAAAAITISDHNHAHLREQFPAQTARLQRIHNGIDLTAFGWSDPASRSPGIISVGRLVPKKGFDVLLDAMALLRAEGDDTPLTLVGAGPLAGPLASRAGELGGIQLLGPMPQGEVRRLVGAASVFAAPCRISKDGNRDGLPTVLLEAMALGTPCVATPVTGIPEAVEHERTGLLVRADDPVALAGEIKRLLTEPALRTRLATQARARVEETFDLHRQAARLAAVTVGATAPGRVES